MSKKKKKHNRCDSIKAKKNLKDTCCGTIAGRQAGGKRLSDFRGQGAGMCEAMWQAIHFHDCGINSADRARRRVGVAPRALVPAPLRSDLARYVRFHRVFNAHFAR